jgi:phosphoglycolate phosphatase
MNSLLVFDYDGVLIDSYDVFMPAFIDACQDAGYLPVFSEREFVRLFDDNLYESMIAQGIPRTAILRIVLKVKEAVLANHDKLQIFPGMTKVVRSLAVNHCMVVATSNDTSMVRQLLADHHLDCFDDIIGSDQEPSKTKSLLILKNKFEDLPVYFIGDTIGDIKEGQRAGVCTIGATWGWHGARVTQAVPDHVVTSPSELAALFTNTPPAR